MFSLYKLIFVIVTVIVNSTPMTTSGAHVCLPVLHVVRGTASGSSGSASRSPGSWAQRLTHAWPSQSRRRVAFRWRTGHVDVEAKT